MVQKMALLVEHVYGGLLHIGDINTPFFIDSHPARFLELCLVPGRHKRKELYVRGLRLLFEGKLQG